MYKSICVAIGDLEGQWSNRHRMPWIDEKCSTTFHCYFSVAKSFATPGTTALQVLLSVLGVLQARIWGGLPFPSPRDLPGSGIKPESPALARGFFTTKHQGSPQLLGRPLKHWRKTWQPTPAFLPRESQGQRSLVGCPIWGHTESDTTEWLSSICMLYYLFLCVHLKYSTCDINKEVKMPKFIEEFTLWFTITTMFHRIYHISIWDIYSG